MGILQTLLTNKDTALKTNRVIDSSSVKPGTSGTADDILTDDDEVERLSKYIDDKESKKIIGTRLAIKHGVDKIGTKNDKNEVLGQLLSGAHKSAKEYAAKILSRMWSRKNLIDKITTKSGKEIIGKVVSKNIYIKQVSVTYKTGKHIGQTITYLQARNRVTGRIVKLSTATRMIK